MTNTLMCPEPLTVTDPLDMLVRDESGKETTFRALAKRYRRESRPRGVRVKQKRQEADG